MPNTQWGVGNRTGTQQTVVKSDSKFWKPIASVGGTEHLFPLRGRKIKEISKL